MALRLARLATAPAVLLLAGACRADGDRDERLDGEWRIELSVVRPAIGWPDPVGRSTGKLVISSRIPDYMKRDPGATESRPTFYRILGRHFVDRRPLYLPADSIAAEPPYRSFTPSLGADFFEQLEGGVDSTGTVEMLLTPYVTHVGIQLRGRARGDTVAGTWTWYGGNPVWDILGTFRMVRVPRTELWRKAIRRARRTASASPEEWNREWDRL